MLRSWVRIPPGTWIFVCCECRVLSGRGLCDELISHPEESYRLWCVVVCDLETSRICVPYMYDISSLRVKDSLPVHPSIYIQRHCDIMTDRQPSGYSHLCRNLSGKKLRFGVSITVHAVRHVAESDALYTPIWMDENWVIISNSKVLSQNDCITEWK